MNVNESKNSLFENDGDVILINIGGGGGFNKRLALLLRSHSGGVCVRAVFHHPVGFHGLHDMLTVSARCKTKRKEFKDSDLEKVNKKTRSNVEFLDGLAKKRKGCFKRRKGFSWIQMGFVHEIDNL